jgi:multicomponent Na+:H+ antiporter subunit E
MKGFLANLVLAAIWAVSMGEINLENLATGFVIAYLLLWWLRPVAGDDYVRKGPRAIGLLAFFLWELWISSLLVARDVLTKGKYRKPGFIAVPLDAETDLEITLLAILVTLTPGTIVLEVADDRRSMFVHVMFLESPEASAREIKSGFERRILELLR